MMKNPKIEISNIRARNASIAQETLKVCRDKQYFLPNGEVVDISASLDSAFQGTILYSPNSNLTLPNTQCVPFIEVVNETTSQAAVRLQQAGHTHMVALNFASAICPGGGFLAGEIAQEEDLCRASGLYPCVRNKPAFYNSNNLGDSFYTDHIIYSPNVPFFRDEELEFLEIPFELSIITSPAPSVRDVENVDENKLYYTFYNRALQILQIAAHHQHTTLILGAWGCGAFRNDPALVATIFSKVMKEQQYFKHICFAVYDKKTPPYIFETFNKVLSSAS